MSEKWFGSDHTFRLKKCLVPEDVRFLTKPEIALNLLKELEQKGFHSKVIGVDAVFGSNTAFIDSIRDEYVYFASINPTTKVWIDKPEVGVSPYKGRGRYPTKIKALTPSIQVNEIANYYPDFQLEEVVLNRGSKGFNTGKMGILRVFESRNDLPGQEVWLIARDINGQMKYLLCNAPAETPVENIYKWTIMRWPIEQCLRAIKDVIGMDEYEFRSWPAWHRHMTYVLMAYNFSLQIQNKFLLPFKEDPFNFVDMAFEPKRLDSKEFENQTGNQILVPSHKTEIPISQTQSDNAEITQWNINKKNNEQAGSNQKQNKEKKNPIALGTAREADTDTTRQEHNTLEDQEPCLTPSQDSLILPEVNEKEETSDPIALDTTREAGTDTTRQEHNTLEDREPCLAPSQDSLILPEVNEKEETSDPIALDTTRETDTDTTRQEHNTLEDQEPDTNSQQNPNQSINLASQTVLIPLLSIYMVLYLISDSIDKMCLVNTTAIERVDYYLKRNYISTGSCIKMQEIKLRKRKIFDVMPFSVIKSA